MRIVEIRAAKLDRNPAARLECRRREEERLAAGLARASRENARAYNRAYERRKRAEASAERRRVAAAQDAADLAVVKAEREQLRAGAIAAARAYRDRQAEAQP